MRSDKPTSDSAFGYENIFLATAILLAVLTIGLVLTSVLLAAPQ